MSPKNKSILIITDFQYLPPNEGNRRRLFDLIEYYRANGLNVSCLYLGKNNDAADAMRKHLNGRLFVYSDSFLLRLSFYLQRARSLLGHIFNIEAFTNFSVGLPTPRKLQAFVQTLIRDNHFDAVQIEYLYLVNVIKGLRGVYKIVDTHDVMGRRWASFRRRGLLTTWYSIKEADEKRALGKFNCAIAISSRDYESFREVYSLSNVRLLDFIYPVKPLWNPNASAFLFIGSNNRMNRSGLKWFIENVYPLICKDYPGFRLRVAGSVGLPFKDSLAIEVLGFVNDIESLYADARLVINPVSVGTGLPIKTLEALSLGVPVVCFREGARGFEEFENMGLFLSRDANEFATHIKRAIQDITPVKNAANGLLEQLRIKQTNCKEQLSQLLCEF